jgi:hypothetical protein
VTFVACAPGLLARFGSVLEDQVLGRQVGSRVALGLRLGCGLGLGGSLGRDGSTLGAAPIGLDVEIADEILELFA